MLTPLRQRLPGGAPRLHAPLTVTLRAPLAFGPAIALEYRNILVPIVEGPQSEEAVEVACRLAAERKSTIVAMKASQF